MGVGPTIAVVLAAGEGTRMGTDTPKVLLELAGRTVLERSVAVFDAAPDVDSIVVVAHPDIVPRVAALLSDVGKVEGVVPGGATRSASTRAALDVISTQAGTVLVHDAARPLVTVETVSDLMTALRTSEAATVAVQASDTILRVAAGDISDIPDRSELWHAQTPQGFDLALLRRAYAASTDGVPDFSDDCSIVRRYLPDVAIRVVPGSEGNLKITRPADLKLAEALLTDRGAAP